MNSIWSNTSNLPHFPRLNGDKKTDVLIIGGGVTGILCAHQLAQAGIAYTLVEASAICSGITKDTTAKITAQHGLIYDKLIRQFGVEKARMYLEANQAALNQYREMCANVDCDFEEKDSFVYARHDRKKIEDELAALHRLGVPATFTTQLPLPFSVAGAVKLPNQAQFHPLKFLSAIASGLHIYENTPVLALTPHAAITDNGKIRAEKIIVATHFPFINKHGSYFLKLYQHRSYVIALKHAPEINGMYVDEADTGMSFRSYKSQLLIGGGAHRTGKQGGNWKELERFATRYYPGATQTSRWATQDCMTLDRVPYIGRYAKHTSDFYVATGFNKWGMTSSMAAAAILTDMISGKKNPYAPVFSPSRTILRPQLAINALESAANLLTIADKRCPHLGCALKWNAQEHSWDCPCHGSRFTEKGQLIDNPATGNLKSYTKTNGS